MIDPGVLQLAKKGEPKAIASLMNRSLQPKGITVEAIHQDGCLEIWLKSERVLAQQALVTFIRKGMISLEVESLTKIKVYAVQMEENNPDWTEEIHLVEPKSITQATKPALYQRQFLSTLGTFSFASVFPYQDALSPGVYKSNNVKILLFFALFPLAVSPIVKTGSLGLTAWLLGIYYCSIWAVFLYNVLKPSYFSWSDTLKCSLFTMFIGIPLLLIFQTVPLFKILYTATEQPDIVPQILGFVLGVGVLEESCKALPIYLFLVYPGKLKDPLTAAFYGAMSGLGFAISEGVNYSYLYAHALTTGESDLSFYLLSNTIRLVTLPLNHAIWAGITGYFLGLAAINQSRQGSIIFIGIAICSVLHGCYDTFATNILCLGIVAFSILLFVAYLRRSKQMVDEMQGYRGQDIGDR